MAVRCANRLIAAGPQAAIAALDSIKLPRGLLEESERINEKVCHLTRLIFTATNAASELRAPRLGALDRLPYNSMAGTNWPDLPFLITNGIPLSVSLGYIGVGKSERFPNYLAYCKTTGVFRREPFAIPTYRTVSNSLAQLFDSPRWKSLKWSDGGPGWRYKLDESYAKTLLWKQAENMRSNTR